LSTNQVNILQPGDLACVVLSQLSDEIGQPLRMISIAGSAGLTSKEGLSLFLVKPEQLPD
jgi:hypothetical protein